MEQLINTGLLLILLGVTLNIIFMRNLFGVVVMGTIYSFVMATIMIALDAPDVAMTEAAVGAGISTVLLLGTLYLTKTEEYPVRGHVLAPALVAAATAAALIYGTLDLPMFGTAQSAPQSHVAPYYLAQTPVDIGIPNVVTAVLASYRGFDTLGEVTVVFIGGLGVMILLSGRRRPGGRGAGDSPAGNDEDRPDGARRGDPPDRQA
ncbi:MAG: DUF4040 domain-containing protein [Sneathiellaceae bacterium]